MRFLREQPDIDGSRIGLAGASQAGWIVPLAAQSARPAFMILLVGPTVSVGEEIFYSRLVEFNDTPIEQAYRQTVEILDARIAAGRSFTRVVLPGAGHSLSPWSIWPGIGPLARANDQTVGT